MINWVFKNNKILQQIIYAFMENAVITVIRHMQSAAIRIRWKEVLLPFYLRKVLHQERLVAIRFDHRSVGTPPTNYY